MSNTILNANEELEVAKGQIRQQQAQIQLLTKFLGFALRAADYDWQDGALTIFEHELEEARTVQAEFNPGTRLWSLRVARPADPSVIQ